MLRKPIEYTGFDGVTRTEDFHFHYSQSELVEMEFSIHGGLTTVIDKISKAQDIPSIMMMFKDVVLKAYGEKSEDGRRFIKSPELSKAFSETPAYDKLYMEFLTVDGAIASFINAVIPKKQIDELHDKVSSK